MRQQQQANTYDSYSNLESIERVLRSGRLLLRLINDTLQLQQGDGHIRLKLEPTDPRALVQSVLEMVDPLVRNKGLDLKVECDRAPAQVQTDPLRLQQILTNLLSNAIRYTERGYVSIAMAALADQRWSITISDSGIGISQDDLQHIFEPYFRVGTLPQSDMEKGTGLGLAVVAQLVELMQGGVNVSSQPGQGSTFTVTFPN